MSQTTGAASGSHSTSAATSTQPGHSPVKARQGAEAGADLFSSLLSLLASTALPATDTPPATETTAQDTGSGQHGDAPTDNPLAGLLASLPGWMPPGLTDQDARRGLNPASRSASDATPATAARPGSPDGAAPLSAEARALLQPLEPGAARERGIEIRPERTTGTDKARQAMVAASVAAAEHRGPGRATGTEGAPGIAWVRAGGASETAALVAQRPTVALDERFAASHAQAWGTAAGREAIDDEIRPGEAVGLHRSAGTASTEAGLATVSGGSATGSGEGSLTGDSGHSGPQGGQDSRSDTSAQAPTAPDDTEVTHWGAGHVRHASLRVGGDGQDAIDIRLQMQGQEVQIGFATDDAQTRELLREQAPQVLGELLQRSGVELGSVSVGAQGQHGQHASSGGSAPRSASPEPAARGERADAAATPVAAPVRPRTDGSRPLDVFA